ncbi:hypothetical protein [Pseudomonas sp. M30-35]|uniref:hypothetical protein n=1 Tax=Pseudomonas sp. M30-35 TaxID=1981174 RepID=UPI000B3BFA10|nr:hypothetical protein [Pseudomonas sp. M30-35]ARU87677.1 hypothetical protein B9K09_06725 [Pseudomonas sp. M30-35]
MLLGSLAIDQLSMDGAQGGQARPARHMGAAVPPQAADLPAVQWKLINLSKLRDENPGKHAEQRRFLTALPG